MTDDEKLLAELTRDEGKRNRIYTDTVGKVSGGVGRNLTDVGFSDDEVELMLMNDIDRAVALLDKNAPWWRRLNTVRQRVMVNLCFNMGWGNGKSGLSSFKNTLAAIERGDYATAAKGLQASKWARQVKARADRLIKMMESGHELVG
jgi:lysozyme